MGRDSIPGRYRVRAVHEVDADAPFHYGIGFRRLVSNVVSNVVSVEIAR